MRQVHERAERRAAQRHCFGHDGKMKMSAEAVVVVVDVTPLRRLP